MGAWAHGSMGARKRGRFSCSRAPTLPRPHAPARGFTLVEVVLTILVIGVGLTASLRALPVILKTSETSRRAVIAQQLATDLVAEIALLPFEDPDGSPTFGPESDETGATRAAFDDVDDYAGWSASPPQDKAGTAEPNGTGYTRSVAVVSVDPADFSSVQVDGSTDAVQIVVTVSRTGGRPVTLSTVRLRGANREDTP